MTKFISLSIITVFLFLTGCANVVKKYEGPERSISEIVVLKDGGTEFHYLPGEITYSLPRYQSLTFEGKAGKTYSVMYWYSLDYINGKAWIIENDTGKQVSKRISW